jgi:predicted HNH restriction endonuclease
VLVGGLKGAAEEGKSRGRPKQRTTAGGIEELKHEKRRERQRRTVVAQIAAIAATCGICEER